MIDYGVTTVIDLRDYEERGTWSVVRDGAVPAAELARRLDQAG